MRDAFLMETPVRPHRRTRPLGQSMNSQTVPYGARFLDQWDTVKIADLLEIHEKIQFLILIIVDTPASS